ncbi:MAG: SRPBCC family protein [Proteobacteria bacterium]|nr:SRPBCC family protein [Pseudomonadota bacterium]
MLKKVLLGVLVVVGVILAFAATRPDSFRVERSITIAAPPDRVYPHVADFRAWPQWSPWEKLDPGMQRTLSGPPDGKGAVYAWSGNDKVGAGRMEILDAVPPRSLRIKLDFIRPLEGHDLTEFTFAPNPGGGTDVHWVMSGPSPYLTKLMSVFVSMDSLIGKDFEQGLASLKAVAEH